MGTQGLHHAHTGGEVAWVRHQQLPGGWLAHRAPHGRESHAAFFEHLAVLNHAGAAAPAARVAPEVFVEAGAAAIGRFQLVAQPFLKLAHPAFN